MRAPASRRSSRGRAAASTAQAQRIGHGCPLPCLLHGSAENRSRKGSTFVVVLALPGQNKSAELNVSREMRVLASAR